MARPSGETPSPCDALQPICLSSVAAQDLRILFASRGAHAVGARRLSGDQLVRPRRPFWSPPKRCDLLVRCAAGGRFLTPFRAHLFGETFWFGGRGAAIVTLTSLHHQKGATFWFRGPEPERRAAPTAEFLTSPRHQKGATFWYRGLGAAILGSDQKDATFWFGASRVSRPRSRRFGL